VTPQRLTRLSITVFVVVLLALFAVIFFQGDAEATRRCEAKGYDKETCAWH
jgi:hypothetical protein